MGANRIGMDVAMPAYINEAAERIAALEAENVRLREALENLAIERALIWRRGMTDAERVQGWCDHIRKMNEIARAALKETADE
jgi:hypothetical protein